MAILAKKAGVIVIESPGRTSSTKIGYSSPESMVVLCENDRSNADRGMAWPGVEEKCSDFRCEPGARVRGMWTLGVIGDEFTHITHVVWVLGRQAARYWIEGSYFV